MALPALFFALCGTAPVLDDSGRPVLSGPEQVHLSADGRFRVHYTMQGADALLVAGDSDPENGVPDTVDWVEEGAAKMWAVFVGADGWPAPPSDEGVGGDDRIDFYLRDLAGNGCTHDDTLPSGHMASYIEVAPARASFGKAAFESIAGHELHHVLEFALTDTAPNWIAEATATYAQYLVFTGDGMIDTLRGLLWRLRLGQPERALDSVGGDFEYAGMVWAKYLVDRGGRDRENLLSLWQLLAQTGDVVAGHDAFVAAHLGLASFDDAAADFAVWNWFACSSDDGRHYDPSTLGCAGGSVPAKGLSPLPASGTSPAVGRRGSTYLVVAPDCATGELDVTLRPTGRATFRIVEEAVDGESPVLAADGTAGADTAFVVPGWNQYRRLAIVATSLAATPTSFDYTVSARGDALAALPATAELSIAPQALALQANGSATLALTATFGTCSDGAGAQAAAAWHSSDPSVASVDGGRVVAHRVGSATIDATLGSARSNPVAVAVTAAPSPGGCGVATGGLDGSWLVALLLLGARRHNKYSRSLRFSANRK
jgi:hypothetical protein